MLGLANALNAPAAAPASVPSPAGPVTGMPIPIHRGASPSPPSATEGPGVTAAAAAAAAEEAAEDAIKSARDDIIARSFRSSRHIKAPPTRPDVAHLITASRRAATDHGTDAPSPSPSGSPPHVGFHAPSPHSAHAPSPHTASVPGFRAASPPTIIGMRMSMSHRSTPSLLGVVPDGGVPRNLS